jgi:hypothetical protein
MTAPVGETLTWWPPVTVGRAGVLLPPLEVLPPEDDPDVDPLEVLPPEDDPDVDPLEVLPPLAL